MKTVRIYIFVLLFFAILQTSQSDVRANDEWVKLRSKNFQLIGDAGEKDMRETIARLETFREVFTQLFPSIKFNSPIPTTVIVFKTGNSFNLYKSSDAKNKLKIDSSGYFLNGEDTNYIVVSAENLKTGSFRQIYHQYTHLLIDNNLGKTKIPPWFYEGLAEYYEDFKMSNDGKINLGIIRNEYSDLLKYNNLIPFETFFQIDYYTLHQQEREEGESLFYAQAWALIHFLMDKKPTELHQFIELILSGQSPKEAFIKAFNSNFAGLEKNLKDYLEQKSFQTRQETIDKSTDSKFSTISGAESEFYLGDLLYHLNRFDEAENHLRQALNLNPNLNDAQALLGLIKAKQFKYDEAQTFAEKAVADSDVNYLNYFRYAYILSRRGMTDYGFVSGYNFVYADKMREALKKAIALNPDFAESYNLFALICFVRNDEIDEAIGFIKKALEIAPGNQQYLLRLAELNLRKENFTGARKNALDVFQTASEPGLRLYAQNTIQRIDSTEAQLMQFRRDKDRYVNDDTVTDTPMSDEEIARRRAKAILDSIRKGLRIPADGQKRIAGNLIKIECESNRVNFVVKTENDIVKLQADSLEGINLITYNQNMSGAEIGCGDINKENNAVIIYRVAENVKTKILGEIVSIEFVPKEFKLAGKNE